MAPDPLPQPTLETGGDVAGAAAAVAAAWIAGIFAGCWGYWRLLWFHDGWADLLGYLGVMLAATCAMRALRLRGGARPGGRWPFVLFVVVFMGVLLSLHAWAAGQLAAGGRTSATVIERRERHWHLGRGHSAAWQFRYRWRAGGFTLSDVATSDDSAAFRAGDSVWVRWWPADPEVHHLVDGTPRRAGAAR